MAGAPTMPPHLKEALETGQIDRLFALGTNCLQHVDFHSDSPAANINGERYQFLISGDFPVPRTELACIFPNHKKTQNLVIDANKFHWLTDFNRAINKAFSNSVDNAAIASRVKIAVAYGDHMFLCNDVTGTIYIVWANYVNRINASNVAKTIYTNTPILFNFDGRGKAKSLFILKTPIKHAHDLELMPITSGSPVLIWPKAPIFVCEVCLPHTPKQALHTMSASKAIALVSQPVHSTNDLWILHERNLFKTQESKELFQLVGVRDNAVLLEDASHIPSFDSETICDDARDPFEEDEEHTGFSATSFDDEEHGKIVLPDSLTASLRINLEK